MIRKYSWIPDVPDQRDIYYCHAFKGPKKKLPPLADLSPWCSPVEDQGPLGSCTANALAGAMEYLEVKTTGRNLDFSRLFIYFNERVLEGNADQDAGAQLRDGIKTLADKGTCPESLWPYNVARYRNKPPDACYQEAKKHLITSYLRLSSLDEMKATLADGFPFVFGFAVYQSFESAQVARTGTVPMPKKGERMIGGHAVLGVGYDDLRGRVKVRNSWGPKWGKGGYFTLPYAYLENGDLSADFWTIRQEEL